MTACCSNGTHPVIFRFEHIGIPETDKEKSGFQNRISGKRL